MGDSLRVPAVHSPLVSRAVCSRGGPSVGHLHTPVVVGLTTVGALVSRPAPPRPVGSKAIRHAVAVGPLEGRLPA